MKRTLSGVTSCPTTALPSNSQTFLAENLKQRKGTLVLSPAPSVLFYLYRSPLPLTFLVRFPIEERRRFHSAFNESKQTGSSIEVLLSTFHPPSLLSSLYISNDPLTYIQLRLGATNLSGGQLPSGVFFNYLYTDPNTSTDM